MTLLVAALTKLVLGSILKKAIGGTIAFFIIIGFLIGFVVARMMYHRR